MSSIIKNLKIGDQVQWWLSELAGMLPRVNVPSMNANSHDLSVEIENREFSLNWPNKEVAERHQNKFHANDAISSYQTVTNQDAKLKVNSCDLRISSKLILQKEISLPLATEENLENVISYEIDRYTPFKKDDVYFNVKIKGRNKKEKKIHVVLSVIKRKLLDEVLEFSKACEISVGDIYRVDNGIDENINFVDFLGDVGQQGKSSAINKWLWWLVVLLTICALIMPIAKNYWLAQKLSEELAVIEGEVTEVRELLKQYKNVQSNVSLVKKLNVNNTKVIKLLNDLTKIIPDDTSLSRFALEEGVVRIQGVSDAASKLIPMLDASDGFDDVRFVAPVTQDRNSGKEKFTIEIALSGVSHAE